MGQYHYLCNLDKHEYLDPNYHSDGLKLMEFGQSSGGTLTALAILLASSNGRGGGDFYLPDDEDSSLIGSWAGDRIAIIGDYFEDDDVPGFTDVKDTPWSNGVAWTCISHDVQQIMKSAEEDRESSLKYFENLDGAGI
jgi:hypothetical protein